MEVLVRILSININQLQCDLSMRILILNNRNMHVKQN
jgi:hypothetical protein